MCYHRRRNVCVVTSQAVFLLRRPPPIFGRGRALKHVWNSWTETDREAEIGRRALRGRETQGEAETTRLLGKKKKKKNIRVEDIRE